MSDDYGGPDPMVAEYNRGHASGREIERRVADDEIKRLRKALKVITEYPNVRDYVGSLVHDAALSALTNDTE